MTPSREESARTTARGFILITGAKAWFFVAAVLLNFGLPWLLPSQADYGTYGVVINTVSLINMVVITATLQAVAKLVSERPETAPGVVRSALRLQAGVGLPLAVLYFALAGVIASALRDPAYTPLLQISAVVVASYSFYAVFVGYFNGLRAFGRQAALDIMFSTLRMLCILGAVALGFGVMGAIAGFSIASVVILVVSAAMMRAHAKAGDFESSEGVDSGMKRLAAFLVAIMVFTFLVNGMIRVDLFLLKSLSADALSAYSGEVVSEASNALAGCYNLMLNIARLPYQGVIAITFVIFPVISRATFEQDLDATRSYIQQTMRYTLMLVLAIATVLAACGTDIVRPLYPDYAYGGTSLLLLCLAYACFSLFYVACTMLIAAGRPGVAIALSGGTLLALSGLCWVLMAGLEAGPEMLDACGLAMLLGMSAGLIATGGVMIRFYGAFVPWSSLVRLLLLAGGILALGEITRFDRFVTVVDPVPVVTPEGVTLADPVMEASRVVMLALAVVKSGVLFLLFVGGLLISGEINTADRERLRRLLKRKKKNAS